MNNNTFYFGKTNGVVVKQANGTVNVLSITTGSSNPAGYEAVSVDTKTLYTFGAESLKAYDTASLNLLSSVTALNASALDVAPIRNSSLTPNMIGMFWSNGTAQIRGFPTQYLASLNIYDATFGSPQKLISVNTLLIACSSLVLLSFCLVLYLY